MLTKRPILVVYAVVITAIIVAALLHRADEKLNRRTARVEKQDVEDVVLAEGTLEGRTQVDVGSQASGQVKSLKVRVGDKVTKGQLLAEIDSTVAENELKEDQAQEDLLVADRAAASARLFEAETALRRNRIMLAEDATSRQELVRAETEYRSRRAQLKSVEANIRSAHMKVETAKAHLDFTKIVAPNDGEVVAIVSREGQTVNAQQETPVILKLADLDTMTVSAEVSEADVHRVHLGQTACFTTLGEPEQRYCGKLRSIEPAPRGYLESNRQRGTGGGDSRHHAIFYNALFDVPNPKHKLRIAMTAEVSIAISGAKEALTIPSEAVRVKAPDGSYEVHIVDDRGKTVRRSVRIGINNGVKAQVLGGLKDGETIVLDGGSASDGLAKSEAS
ncbi:efflux RND transporter periplasmic adaptor subunit [Caballeronia sp. LZ035]|uniref:efflux RND transporter periplasmic adaptor subunit n=1 Tax=Caballeronia sp. LZ035 TaxID=3038568 RepID=UPI00286775E6|nr:efflux RND transporter periplasmic adaptor subunit [Caballeronia sp. LZ035]MDR5755612.1 efflux RND transporter periplasmic adaptor subunit [Caballeronia sp. LZ035]